MTEFSRETSKIGFTDRLAYANGLQPRAGFRDFLFFPGMLFASRQKWWADGSLRAGFHEGLDLCFFESDDGCRFRLDETARVPAAFDSRVTAVIDDFIGCTVIAKQNLPSRPGQFFILYAHIRPDESLRPGQALAAGHTFATLAPAAQNSILPPHLHLSVIPCEKMPSLEKLDWPLLNTLETDRFLDPCDVTGCGGRVIDFHPGMNLFDDFARMG